MNIVVLSGSPRKGANTDTMVEAFAETAREAEAVVLVETGDYDEFAAAMAEPEPPFPYANDVIEGYFDPGETPADKRMADLLEDWLR